MSEKDRKIGHRRIDDKGEVSYKKIRSNQLIASIQLGIQVDGLKNIVTLKRVSHLAFFRAFYALPFKHCFFSTIRKTCCLIPSCFKSFQFTHQIAIIYILFIYFLNLLRVTVFFECYC